MPRLAVAILAASVVAGGCGIGFEADPPTIMGTHWRAVSVGGQAPMVGHEPTLTLGPGSVTGSAGCNGYSSGQLAIGGGSFEAGVQIVIGEVAGNAALCQDATVMDMERAFLEILADVEQLRFESGGLVLEGPRGRLQFRQVD